MKIGTVHKASISYTRTMDGFTNQTLHKNFGWIHKPNPAQELWTDSQTKPCTITLDEFTHQILHNNFGRIHTPNLTQELWTDSHLVKKIL